MKWVGVLCDGTWTYVSPESVIERVELLAVKLPLVLQRVRVVAEFVECVRVPQWFRVCDARIVVEDRADVGHGVGRTNVVTSPHGGTKMAQRT